MNPLARLGAAAGTALLALGLAAPAHAGSYTYYDAAGDVYTETCTYTEDFETDECTDGEDPTITEGDVIASSIQHRDRKVVLRTRYRELTPQPEGIRYHVGHIQTNEGIKRDVFLLFRGAWGEGFFELSRPNGDRVRCSLGKTVSYAEDLIEVRIPRSCLSRPRWIRAGQGHVWGSITETETETGTVYSDSFHADDAHATGMTDELKLSPRVYRG